MVYAIGQKPSQMHFPLTLGENYKVKFSYHYEGQDDGKANVFHGTLLSNEVEFRVE